MGILDNKSRVLDVVVTTEGKRQLLNGKLKIVYASFSDAGMFYSADAISGSADPTSRLSFEAVSLPSDQLTFESTELGDLLGNDSMNHIMSNGKVVVYETSANTTQLQTMTSLSGSALSDAAESILGLQNANFQKLMLLGTRDRFYDENEFEVGPNEVRFQMMNDKPIVDESVKIANVNSLDSLFSDVKLSQAPNFAFLPPRNKNGKIFQGYRALGATQKLTYDQLSQELKSYERSGYCKTVRFDPTSKDNNIVCQVFEQGFDSLKKLDIIDFGLHQTSNTNVHVFFVGKLLVDSMNTHTFVHIFTLVFE